MLKEGIEVRIEKGINYIYSNGERIKYTHWLGDLFSFLYDSIMKKSVFPKKFEASIGIHNNFLKDELKDFHNKNIIELATGSGNLSDFLPPDNNYSGIDISNGLLKIAYRKFFEKGFNDFKLFLCSANDLPFQDNYFDVCICNLSLNFFNDIKKIIEEIKRVLKNNGLFICSVPVPERNKKKSVIRGNLYSEKELKGIFENKDFIFYSYDSRNGALLYFKAIKK